jgi:hypothetical protein
MSERTQTGGPVYICPMHKDVRQATPGKCPTCGMALMPEGTRFAIVRHMLSSPMPKVVMGAVIVALIVAAMMLWK